MTIASDVIGTKRKKSSNIIAIFFVIFAILFLVFLFYKMFNKGANKDVPEDNAPKAVTVTEKKFNFTDPAKTPNTTERTFYENDVNPPKDLGFIGENKPIQSVPKVMPKVSRSGGGGTLIFNKDDKSQSTSGSSDYPAFIEEDKKDMFASESQNFKATSAFKSSYDENLLLEQGTYIPCVLRQKLISNVGGQISCTVSSNVLSKSGNVVLLEKGTMINGMYKSAGVKRGSNQIFVIWQQARTANNLVVNLNSGSTDELGANGLSGWVDQHFWERFGNAIVISMINDASSAVSTQLQKSDTQNYLQNTQNDSSNIAQTIIEKMGDIEPTLYKNQGDKVGVFVARDIDFSAVYSLRLSK